MDTEAEMKEEFHRLVESLDKAFKRAAELNANFEKSEKPRQRKIVEILHKHGLPAFMGPFFDAYFRISLEGGDIEKLSLVIISRLSGYLGEDPTDVGRRHKDAVAEYVEFMSRDLSEGSAMHEAGSATPAME